MMNLEEKKEQEIKNMVTILKQIDLPDIILLTTACISNRSETSYNSHTVRYKAITRII